MATWYKADRWSVKITPVEVLKETDHFITLAPGQDFYAKERRVAKSDEYFKTFTEARQFLMTLFSNQMESHKQEIERLRDKFHVAFNLEPNV